MRKNTLTFQSSFFFFFNFSFKMKRTPKTKNLFLFYFIWACVLAQRKRKFGYSESHCFRVPTDQRFEWWTCSGAGGYPDLCGWIYRNMVTKRLYFEVVFILTSFLVRTAPKNWSKYLFWLFSTFFIHFYCFLVIFCLK